MGSTTVEEFEEAQRAVLDHYGTQATSRYIEIDQPALRVHLLEAGKGRPVILLHGGGGMAVQMEPLLGRLANRHRVLALDRPGCGLTDPFDYSGVDFRAHAREFLVSAMDALKLDTASIVAGSIAGMWALEFGLSHPDRVERIALVGSAAGLTSHVPLPLRLAGTPLIGSLLFATAMQPSKGNTRRQFEEFVVHTDRVPEALVEATYVATALPGAHQSFKTMVQQIIGPTGMADDCVLADELPALDRPVLFVWGAEDVVYPPSIGEKACEALPDGRMEVVPEAGHFVWLDAPDATATTVASFLNGADAQRGLDD